MNKIIKNAIKTFELEAKAIANLSDQLTDDFLLSIQSILDCKGKVIITGMGKSGIIGSKIAATLSSTGTPAIFMHPGDAYHGDLGMIDSKDIVIAISYSGQTDEILKLIPFLEENQNRIIAITGNSKSVLAKHSSFILSISIEEEACPLNLAPTASTTATLAMGDAIAVCLMKEKNFKLEDFARYHPGGNLGKRLLTKVKDIMHRTDLPVVDPLLLVKDVLFAISKSRLGLAVVVEDNIIKGVITDGDIRRNMEINPTLILDMKAKDIMSKDPKIIEGDSRINVAEELMRINKIHSLLVADEYMHLKGILELYDVAKY